jgi:DNA repair exonuclease SbcCD ATPase subunit
MQLSELHNKISQLLRDMETLISDQKRIRQLYDAENKSLSKYETAALELTSMEKILNPYTGLPSVYTRKYIEKILNHVNYFISRVFTYKLEVSLVEDVKNMKYKFSVKVDDVPAGDISDCSDGQMEIIDLAFTLALMIALGIYKTHPIFLDEVGRCFDSYHTQRLLEMLSDLVDQGYISQLFIINHQAVLAGGFDKADVICLRSENIVLPEDYNQHVVIR